MNNDRLTTSLRKHEGFRSTVYTCPAGKLTIGIGRCIDISVAGAGITQAEAEYLLRQDINRFTAMTRGLIVTFDSLDDVRQETLVELCFQHGTDKSRKIHQDARCHRREGLGHRRG
jgi:lysozyme